jgi:hypothetical protein
LALRPLVKFFHLLSGGRPPQRADRSAGGLLPTRAYRYCEAVTAAAGFGWYLFPPIDFKIAWDGTEFMWSHSGKARWQPLGTAQFPGFAKQFDVAAPKTAKGYSPPFLGATSTHGMIQMWSGVIARTRPGWSLLVRTPAILPRGAGYEMLEGIIESDRWFGPLFNNIRVLRTDRPVEFRKDFPFMQVQPIPRDAYDDKVLNSFVVERGMQALGDSEWAAYHETVVSPNKQPARRLGRYAVAARKRRAAGHLARDDG